MEEGLYGIRILDVEVSEESRGRGKDRPGASVEIKMANDEKSFGGPGVDKVGSGAARTSAKVFTQKGLVY